MLKNLNPHKNTIFVLTGVLLILLAVVFILTRQTGSLSAAYVENGNIFLSNSDRSVTRQVTPDGVSSGIGQKYGYPMLALSGEVYFIGCRDSLKIGDNNLCALLSYSISNESINQIASLEGLNYIKESSIAWAPKGKYLVLASQNKLFIWQEETPSKFKEILTWEILNVGIGGEFCDGTIISEDGERFVFCSASALGTSVQGSLFLFDKTGSLIKRIDPASSNLSLGITDPKFLAGGLSYYDDSISQELTVDL